MKQQARSEQRVERPWNEAALRDAVTFLESEGCAVRRDEPLARHTSMRVGGPAPLMLWPPHPEAVAATISWLAAHGLAWRVLGGGTNVLASEAGIAEAAINLTRLTQGTSIEAPTITFPAGMTTSQAMRIAARQGLAGLDWSTGLPGTIGGAAAGNAGCWGGEISDVVQRLDLVGPDGAWQALPANQLNWSYRHVDLEAKDGAGAVIVRVTVDLKPGDRRALEARSQELQELKRQCQPVGARNAGCIFKNPDRDRSAGQLVDEAGCKGLRVGGAEVSTLHGNFIINDGCASADDVDELIGLVRESVRQHHGVSLEEEIRRW